VTIGGKTLTLYALAAVSTNLYYYPLCMPWTPSTNVIEVVLFSPTTDGTRLPYTVPIRIRCSSKVLAFIV
jgi:hypothetical protein